MQHDSSYHKKMCAGFFVRLFVVKDLAEGFILIEVRFGNKVITVHNDNKRGSFPIIEFKHQTFFHTY